MNTGRQTGIPTRASLIERIRNPDDQTGWEQFYATYRRLIGALARKRGLTEFEAEDVTHDTMIAVLKAIGRFRYDPERCSFKTWLNRLAQARITDFLRRRPKAAPVGWRSEETRTDAVERLPDAATAEPGLQWEAEWRQAVVDLALRRLRQMVQPLHYQVFYLHALKGQTPRQVARGLGLNVAQVYLVKHRVGRAFRQVVAKVRQELEIAEEGTSHAPV